VVLATHDVTAALYGLKSRVNSEVEVEAAGVVEGRGEGARLARALGSGGRKWLVEDGAVVAHEATEGMAGEGSLLFEGVGLVGRTHETSPCVQALMERRVERF
jgi:hypothetical protein